MSTSQGFETGFRHGEKRRPAPEKPSSRSDSQDRTTKDPTKDTSGSSKLTMAPAEDPSKPLTNTVSVGNDSSISSANNNVSAATNTSLTPGAVAVPGMSFQQSYQFNSSVQPGNISGDEHLISAVIVSDEEPTPSSLNDTAGWLSFRRQNRMLLFLGAVTLVAITIAVVAIVVAVVLPQQNNSSSAASNNNGSPPGIAETGSPVPLPPTAPSPSLRPPTPGPVSPPDAPSSPTVQPTSSPVATVSPTAAPFLLSPSPTDPQSHINPTNGAVITLDNSVFAHGETVEVTFSRPDLLQSSDLFALFPEGQNDFTADPTASIRLSSQTAGTILFRITVAATGRFRPVFIIPSTDVVYAVGPVFEILAPEQGILTTDMTTYQHGETIYATMNPERLSSSDRLHLFREGVIDYSTTGITSLVLSSAATTGSISLRVTVQDTGSFKLVVLIAGTSIAAGVSDPIEISAVEDGALLIDKSSYLSGETIIAQMGPERLSSSDYLHIFNANVTDYSIDSLASVRYSSAATTGTLALRITLPNVGGFKLVALISGTTVSSGVSDAFTISAPGSGEVLSTDKSSYQPGEDIVSTMDPSLLSTSDYLHLYSENVTDYSTPSLFSVRFSTAATKGILSFRVSLQHTGSFKVVVLISGTTVVSGVSDIFTISSPTSEVLSTDKLSYQPGEYLVATMNSSFLSTSDYLHLYAENETDYSTPSIFSLRVGSAASEGALSFRIALPNVGRFKVVVLVAGTNVASGMSPTFAIAPPAEGVLTTDQSSYISGQTLKAEMEPDLLGLSDYLHIFPSSVTDYSTESLGSVRLSSNANTGSFSVRVTVPVTGSYKAVVIVTGTDVASGISAPFSVSVSGSDALITDKASYRIGETILATMDPMLLTSSDFLHLYPAAVTNYSTSSLDYVRLSSSATSGSMSMRVTVTNVGAFKVVVLAAGTTLASGAGAPFTLSGPDPDGLTTNNSSYVHGTTIVASMNPLVLSSNDYLHLYPEEVTDYLTTSLASVRVSSGATAGTMPFRITVPDVGSFKVVVLLSGTTVASGTSASFTISAPSDTGEAILTTDKSNYQIGESIVTTLNPTLLSSSDYLHLFPTTETDYSTNSLLSIRLSSGAANGKVGLRVAVSDVGSFKVVVIIGGNTLAIGVSDSFTISAPGDGVLTTDKSSYRLGESIVATMDPLLLYSNDCLHLYPESEGEYSTDTSLASMRLSSAATSGTPSLRVTVSEAGTYKVAMLLVSGVTTLASGVSPSFTIEAAPDDDVLVVGNSTYLHGETILATMDPTLLSSSDYLHLYPADVADYSATSPSSVRLSSDATSGSLSIRITVSDVGSFKLVVLIAGTTVASGVSAAFVIAGH